LNFPDNMLFIEKPEHFNPIFEVVSLFCEFNGKILLLLRREGKSEGGKWGVPAGKREESDKSLLDATIRELNEETGIELKSKNVNYFLKTFVRFPDYDFIYHIFHTKLDKFPEVEVRADEHQDFLWVTPKGALRMNLVKDLDWCIRVFYNKKKGYYPARGN